MRWVIALAGLAVAVLGVSALLLTSEDRGAEAERLAALLELRPGMNIAEIGAGTGWLTVEMAERIGPSGQAYSTELSAERRDDIKETAAAARVDNVEIVEAGEATTNLPPGCCDAIFMRRVYHHLSNAPAINASLYEALRPGGRLVIIDFEAQGFLGVVTHMGIAQADLISQVTAAGFELVQIENWPAWNHYAASFRKAAGRAAAR